MNKIILLRGCPGSGKTTYFKKFLQNNPDYVGYSVDSITEMLIGVAEWQTNNLQDMVYSYQTALLTMFVSKSIKEKRNIIIDDCNISSWVYNIIIAVMQLINNNYIIEYKDFYLDLNTLKEINCKRKLNSEHCMQEDRLEFWYNKYVEQLKNEEKL